MPTACGHTATIADLSEEYPGVVEIHCKACGSLLAALSERLFWQLRRKEPMMDKATRIEILAAACHSAWYAYTVLALGEEGERWARAPAWQQRSIREGVRFWDDYVDAHTQAVARGPREEVYAMLAAASHDNWMNLKQVEGWVYGEVKDPEKKTHPCMVPYAELPEAQRKKDEVVLQAYFAVRPLLPDPNACAG